MKERLEYVLAGRDELTRPLKRAENQMKSLGNQAQRTNKQMGAFSSNLTGMQRDTRKFAMGSLQQAGFQIGDFAVQVANGTSKMQAFGQQAPQFLQIFGPVGSVVGAAVAIFAAFGVAAQKAGKGTVSLKDSVKNLSSSIQELEGIDKLLEKNLEAPMLAANAALSAFLADLRQTKLEAVIGDVRKAAQGVLDPFFDRVSELDSIIERTRGNIDTLIATEGDPQAVKMLMQRVEALEATRDTLKQINRDVAFATIAESSEELADNLLNVRQSLKEQGLLTDYLAQGFDKILEAGGLMNISLKKQERLKVEINDAIAEINQGELYHDAILRQQLINLSNLKVKYDEMVASQRKSGFAGGRGSDPRQFTYMDEFRKQLKQQDDARNAANKAASNAARKLKSDIIKLTPEMQRIMDVSESIGQSFEKAFMSAVDGSMKAKDAFRTMAADIIKELYRVFVVKQITGFITDAASLFLGPKVGAVSMGPKAIGGPVQAGGSYLVGERGPELFRPARSGSITPNDQLGGGTIVVNQTINVSTGVQQTVRTEIKSLMPQIAESAKAAVADAKRRGGSYGRAFA